MPDDNGNILAQIRQLRADAGQSLKGNEYFAVAQKLDAIVAGSDTDGEAAQAKLQAIRSELAGPSSPVTEAPNEILEDLLALRAKAGERLQGNAYFSVAHKLDALLASGDLTSASARDTLESIRSDLDGGAPATAPSPAATEEPSQTEAPAAPEADAVQTIMFPKANSFGTPQPTVSVSFAAVETTEEAPAEEAQADNAQVEPAAPSSSPDVSALNTQHAPETEEKTGFEALAEASWRRVQEVAGPDELSVKRVNGAAVGGMTADKPAPDHVAAPEIEQAEEGAEPGTVEAASEVAGSAIATVEEIQDEPVETVASELQPKTVEAASEAIESATVAAEEIHDEPAETGASEPQPETVTDDVQDKPAETAVSEPEPAQAASVEAEAEAPSTTAPEVESASDGETVTAATEDQEPFKVVPRPTIINRPVKKERFARLKRLAKLPYLPKRRT